MEPLRKKADFSKTYRQGKQARNSHFSVKAVTSSIPNIKLAVVVSKKVSKKAVVRNKARRRFREIVRKNISLADGGYLVIVNIYTDLSDISNTDLEGLIVKNFQKLNIFKSV